MKYEDQLRDQLDQDLSEEINALSHRVIGCAIEVHRELGPGYLEQTYQRGLEAELEAAGIPYRRQVPIRLLYKGRAIDEYRLDLVVAETIVVELKAVESLASVHVAQVISYLKAAELPFGLLLNFNVPVLIQGLRRVRPPKRLSAP